MWLQNTLTPHPAQTACGWMMVVENGTYWQVPSGRCFSAVTSLSAYWVLFDEKGKASQIIAGGERGGRCEQEATGKERCRLRGVVPARSQTAPGLGRWSPGAMDHGLFRLSGEQMKAWALLLIQVHCSESLASWSSLWWQMKALMFLNKQEGEKWTWALLLCELMWHPLLLFSGVLAAVALSLQAQGLLADMRRTWVHIIILAWSYEASFSINLVIWC